MRTIKDFLILCAKCEKDKKLTKVVQELVRHDPIWFFNNLLFTYDPREDIKVIPFELYPFQIKYVETLNRKYINKEPLLVEKSRDMGFSWLTIGFFVWKFITEENFSAGIGSRKAELVDTLGNMKSLLERARFMIRMLPPFIKNGYNEAIHSKNNLLVHPNLKSSIAGESGDEIGRGDRTSMYLIDEFAFIQRSAQVQAAVSQTSKCIIYGSTPNGKGNEFARLRFKTNIERFTMHWKDHPNKNEDWYNEQKMLLDEATLAQEIDISYSKSAMGRVYKWFDADTHAKDPQKYNHNYPVYVTFDWGIGDPTSCIFLQDYHGLVRIINFFELKDSSIEVIFQKVFAELNRLNIQLYCVQGWYGDPDARNRNIVTGESLATYILSRFKISLRFKLPNLIRPRVMSVRMMGEQNRIVIDKDLMLPNKENYEHTIIECFENYIYPSKESGENEKPVHNWASHSMSSLEYYMVYEHGMDQFVQHKQIEAIRWR